MKGKAETTEESVRRNPSVRVVDPERAYCNSSLTIREKRNDDLGSCVMFGVEAVPMGLPVPGHQDYRHLNGRQHWRDWITIKIVIRDF